MKKQYANKTIILDILKLLYKYSSIDHPILQTTISNFFNDTDIICDRKTVGRNIKYLQDFGFKIIKVKDKGYYIDKEQMLEKLLK